MKEQFMKKLNDILLQKESSLLEGLINTLASLSKSNICFFATVDSDLKHAHTKIFYSHGEIVDNFSYSLKNTPCHNVILCHQESIYPENVVERFPEDILLDELGIEGYVGSPVINNKKEQVGILVGLYEKPIKDTMTIKKLYQMTAGVVALELEKQKKQERTSFEDIKEICNSF